MSESSLNKSTSMVGSFGRALKFLTLWSEFENRIQGPPISSCSKLEKLLRSWIRVSDQFVINSTATHVSSPSKLPKLIANKLTKAKVKMKQVNNVISLEAWPPCWSVGRSFGQSVGRSRTGSYAFMLLSCLRFKNPI